MSLGPRITAALDGARGSGKSPLAVLDVDLTLVDNAARNRAIWSDWAHSVRDRWSGAGAAAVAAQTMPIVFGVRENLAALGVSDPELVADGLRFWLRGFFGSEYCRVDTALPGAVDAVGELRAAGATVVYLTARPTRMAGATVERLRQLGFPVCEAGTVLSMKPDPKMKDGAYKAATLQWICDLGTPFVCADNEPGHINAMHSAFDGAIAGLVETRHSGGAPPLDTGIERVSSAAALIKL